MDKEHLRKWKRSWCRENRERLLPQRRQYAALYRMEHREELRTYAREYYRANNEKLKKRQNKRWRERCVQLKMGSTISIDNKPLYPTDERCKLCARKLKVRLIYHHWDDEHPEQGMWICYTCHHFAEGMDAGMEMKYKRLKGVK